ncbi:MAG: valine--tRNA ligase [Gemmataceae bacterium]
MSIELPKAFEPRAAQQKWLKTWDEKGYFHSVPNNKTPYTIVIPPPNVTGALHMGHALNNTLQDVLIRWKRMAGFNALWMPGTDHAGIATQAVVERLVLQTEKKTRHDLGRDELVKRIWEWKDKYEARILGQLKELGSSCDWQRTRFTLDETCAKAVRETFFKMFRDGYIFRGKRLVNWDAALQTSVADDETYTEDTKGGFWTFKYVVLQADGKTPTDPPESIRFSTTRPETMLGDSALCVHPSDERYKHLIGRSVTQPHTGRVIPIIADGLLADPTLGTGCVKVTPAHDPNDYACWQRNPQIAMINILNADGTINANGGKYQGQDRYKAREAVIKEMEELGLYEGKEDRVIPLKYSDRSKTPIEPYLSDQWFVKMSDFESGSAQKGLAQMAMDAVSSGRVKFFPDRYAKTYMDWLGEKRDWCISRQLWWGHRIPVWTLKCESLDELNQQIAKWNRLSSNRVVLAPQNDNFSLHVCLLADDVAIVKELESSQFVQSDDVLDTWFSSALWPHSTLGWPEPTPELKYYYPTSTLVTSRDIITLWVARMVLTGLYNLGEVPFHHVYITPKVLDGLGETMSKTKGNGVDPLDIIDQYGADALRFYVTSVAGETQDTRLPVSNVCPACGVLVPVKAEHLSMRTKKLACPSCKKPFRPGGPWPSDDPELTTAKQASDRFEVGRNFANKLWNATRFILMNLDGYTPAPLDFKSLPVEDRWILSRLATAATAATKALEGYHFAELARIVYDFAWNEFCDWYIEMSKTRRTDPVCQRVLVNVLDGIVRLIHPMMPFVSESLWEALNQAVPVRGISELKPAVANACIAEWPSYQASQTDVSTEASIARMQELVRGIRETRNRYQIEKATVDVSVKCSVDTAKELNALAAFITSLGQLGQFECGPDCVKPKQAGVIIAKEFEAYVALAGLIDPVAEVARLEKQIADKAKQLSGIKAKLGNESFVRNAPADVVDQQKSMAAELENQIRSMEANRDELKAGA